MQSTQPRQYFIPSTVFINISKSLRTKWSLLLDCKNLPNSDFQHTCDGLTSGIRNKEWKITKPTQTIEAGGGGDCLFKTFSVILTGLEADHKTVRKNLCDYMEKQGMQTPQEATNGDMRNIGTYGTQREILAFGCALHVFIHLYVAESEAWMSLPPSCEEMATRNLQPLDPDSKKGRTTHIFIELSGPQTNGHFRPIAGVQTARRAYFEKNICDEVWTRPVQRRKKEATSTSEPCQRAIAPAPTPPAKQQALAKLTAVKEILRTENLSREEKIRLRKIRNRETASLSRERKRERINFLERRLAGANSLLQPPAARPLQHKPAQTTQPNTPTSEALGTVLTNGWREAEEIRTGLDELCAERTLRAMGLSKKRVRKLAEICVTEVIKWARYVFYSWLRGARFVKEPEEAEAQQHWLRRLLTESKEAAKEWIEMGRKLPLATEIPPRTAQPARTQHAEHNEQPAQRATNTRFFWARTHCTQEEISSKQPQTKTQYQQNQQNQQQHPPENQQQEKQGQTRLLEEMRALVASTRGVQGRGESEARAASGTADSGQRTAASAGRSDGDAERGRAAARDEEERRRGEQTRTEREESEEEQEPTKRAPPPDLRELDLGDFVPKRARLSGAAYAHRAYPYIPHKRPRF